ncbi:hypothetical protein [Streptomyces sp. TN58]|nr:hypothetical protein [Streptomyces sp. TN58]
MKNDPAPQAAGEHVGDGPKRVVEPDAVISPHPAPESRTDTPRR